MKSYKRILCHVAALGMAAAMPATAGFAQTFTTIHSFGFGSDGAYPSGSLAAIGTTVYGADGYGGSNFGGELFSVTVPGKKTPSTFASVYGFASNANPMSGVSAAAGALYAVSIQGGDGIGALYSITPPSTAATACKFNGMDAYFAEAPPIEVNGVFYGTSARGGSNYEGSIYSYTPGSGCKVLYSFQSPNYVPAALSGQLLNVNGVLYGTAANGGSSEYGSVFAYNIANQTLTTLYSFTGGADGAFPTGGLALSGTTLYGFATGYSAAYGVVNAGTVFAVSTKNGAEKTVYSFTGGSDGAFPIGTPVLKSGALYGVAQSSGSSNMGVVFSVNLKSKAQTVLHSFSGADGSTPAGGLLLVGKTLFGTTEIGGANNYGTIFSLVP